ncbi:MAG: alpha-hydroxy acid oxidase [Comamonas sp.]
MHDKATLATPSLPQTGHDLPAPVARYARRLRPVLCLDDFEAQARRHLPGPVFAYIRGGAERNHTLSANAEAYRAHAFVTRGLVDVSARDTSLRFLGQTYASPFGIAPLGLSALSAYRGDVVLARAAAAQHIPMAMSGSSLIPLEDVARASPGAWFQAYLPGDPGQIEALISRVAQAGYRTLMVTIDTPVAANRENNVRAGFSTPLRPSLRLVAEGLAHPRWLFGTFLKTLMRHGMPHFENNYATRGAPILSPNVLRDFSDRGHLSWTHLSAIRRMWKGDLIVKGILHPDDARLARDTGADALVVSNHGGRQLDGALASLHALPDVARAVPGLPLLLDGGVRRGTDVLKAIALGADGVLVGRPFAYAAAIGGHAGVCHAIDLLKAEISRDMALLGVRCLAELRQPGILRRIS